MSEPSDDAVPDDNDPEAIAIREFARRSGGHVVEIAKYQHRKKKEERKRKAEEEAKLPVGYTARQIVELELPPLKWLVDGLIPAGMIVLASPPKIGKTWLNLQLALAVSTGQRFADYAECQFGKVLFLDLEGGQRREKFRLQKLLGHMPAPEGLKVYFDFLRMDEGGLDLLDKMIAEEGYVLVIIDIWNKFRPPTPRGANLYDWDSQVGQQIQKIARKHDISVVLTHHTKKGSVDDHLESISGSNGLPGAADTNIVITRQRGTGQAVLYVTPRDAKEHHLAVEFQEGRWSILGDAAEIQGSKRRSQIHALLTARKIPMSVKEIAEELDDGARQIRRILSKMVDDAAIERDGKGRYRIKPF
jgi:RecA-family ATPase